MKCDLIKQLYEGNDSIQSSENTPRKQYTSYERDRIANVANGKIIKDKVRRNLISKLKKNASFINQDQAAQRSKRNAYPGLSTASQNMF